MGTRAQSVKFSGTIGRPHPIQKELEKLTDEQLIAIAEGTSNLIAELGERCEREVMTES